MLATEHDGFQPKNVNLLGRKSNPSQLYDPFVIHIFQHETHLYTQQYSYSIMLRHVKLLVYGVILFSNIKCLFIQ